MTLCRGSGILDYIGASHRLVPCTIIREAVLEYTSVCKTYARRACGRRRACALARLRAERRTTYTRSANAMAAPEDDPPDQVVSNRCLARSSL